MLAAPHILVSDNREARIQVGQQVPLITSETYGTVGVAPVRSFQYRDIGIILKVKPRINEGGLVSLDISQEISTYEKLTLSVGDSQLLINKTDVTTDLVVQDNQTIVIGGLIREDTTKASVRHSVAVQNTDHRVLVRRHRQRNKKTGAHYPADTPGD